MYTVVWELLHWTIPAQSQREGRDESLYRGRDPSAYLLANSRCKHNAEFGGLEARGVGGEGWL